MTFDWRVRRATVADLQAILAIEESSLEAPHWSESVWRAVLASEEPGTPLRATFVAERGNQVLGFVVMSCAVGTAELESVAVGFVARHQGIGRALCIAAMDWARSRAAEVVELEVRASNAGALALYRSLGFTERGTRRGYYRGPAEDAVMMAALLRS